MLDTSFFLISAVLVSLAAGVMVAYSICVAMFALFGSQARDTAPHGGGQVTVRNIAAE